MLLYYIFITQLYTSHMNKLFSDIIRDIQCTCMTSCRDI